MMARPRRMRSGKVYGGSMWGSGWRQERRHRDRVASTRRFLGHSGPGQCRCSRSRGMSSATSYGPGLQALGRPLLVHPHGMGMNLLGWPRLALPTVMAGCEWMASTFVTERLTVVVSGSSQKSTTRTPQAILRVTDCCRRAPHMGHVGTNCPQKCQLTPNLTTRCNKLILAPVGDLRGTVADKALGYFGPGKHHAPGGT